MRIFRSASSRTEMAAEDHARSSAAVPEDDFPAEDPFEQSLRDAIVDSMREDEAIPSSGSERSRTPFGQAIDDAIEAAMREDDPEQLM